MRKVIAALALAAVTLPAGAQEKSQVQQKTPAPAAPAATADNPLLAPFTAPFGMPPFEKIRPEHFPPAFAEAIAQRKAEVAKIAKSAETPTFANTVEALEAGGRLLSRVSEVFFTLTGAETNDALQGISKDVSPKLAALRDDVVLDEALFARVKAVWDGRDKAGLTAVQTKLLEETWKDFVRGGANLAPEAKKRLREVNQELSVLGLKFGDNLLKENNGTRLVVERKEDLAGLSAAQVAAAEAAAKAAKLEGKWVFTVQVPSIVPFLEKSEKRDLRQQLLAAYTTRCDHGNETDNKAGLVRIAALRAEKAKLMGFATWADFVLDDNMAKTPAAVYGLLNKLWVPALAMAKEDRAAFQAESKKDGAAFQASDWRFYEERVKKQRYDVDDAALRPYFPLDRVREGAFATATKLYGITFTERTDLPKYHPEVRTWEVKDADGTHLAVYTADYHPRAGKRGGAWCGRIRSGGFVDGVDVRPIVTNVCNFTRGAGDAPALLSLDEVETLFHEFGHALHGILSKVRYRTLSRTPRDFVELPSQIMENWALEPEVLATYAKHWKTGEVIPLALVEKIRKAGTFGEGFKTVEYLAASFLDMDWHTLTPEAAAKVTDATAFESAALGKIGLIPEVPPRYRSPYFQHIFGPGGGYSSGYYSYIWAEVLDADAFSLFKEKGIFDRQTAAAFRALLEKGGSEDVMGLFKKFRGREPSVEPLLVKRGLAPAKPAGKG